MSKSKPEPAAAPEPLYPAIEAFVGDASSEEVSALFASLKSGLGGLKGPAASNGKKIGTAIARTEELLSYLVQLREKIQAERAGQR